jgi:sec-independent protein translocase protein TatC
VSPAKKRQSNFERAADGSMTLIEHFIELRRRLFRACLGILAGSIAGFVVAERVRDFLTKPYCDFQIAHGVRCQMNMVGPLDAFMMNLKIALYVGLILSAPIWLYQLWAFIAPGLHKRERKFGYAFAAVATPLFALGFALGYVLASRSMHWFLGMSDNMTFTVNLEGYFDFILGVMLLFGAGFEFPLAVVMLNFAGVVSARRLLSWWRIAVFLMFLFAALVTPTPDPFNMTILAVCMGALYFAAVGVAFIHDRRKARNALYSDLNDDETSSIEPVSPVDAYRPSDPDDAR